jgi:hypothetical protein
MPNIRVELILRLPPEQFVPNPRDKSRNTESLVRVRSIDLPVRKSRRTASLREEERALLEQIPLCVQV